MFLHFCNNQKISRARKHIFHCTISKLVAREKKIFLFINLCLLKVMYSSACYLIFVLDLSYLKSFLGLCSVWQSVYLVLKGPLHLILYFDEVLLETA